MCKQQRWHLSFYARVRRTRDSARGDYTCIQTLHTLNPSSDPSHVSPATCPAQQWISQRHGRTSRGSAAAQAARRRRQPRRETPAAAAAAWPRRRRRPMGHPCWDSRSPTILCCMSRRHIRLPPRGTLSVHPPTLAALRCPLLRSSVTNAPNGNTMFMYRVQGIGYICLCIGYGM